MMNTADMELRKLPADYLSSIEEILETNEDWKTLMSLIPKNLENIDSEHYEFKYNGEHIRLIENFSKDAKVRCAEVLFKEWGTSGRVRPTLRTLQKLLKKALMFRATDAIANMLGEALPERPLGGPEEPIDVNVTNLLNSVSITQHSNTNIERCNATTRQMKSHNLIVFSTNNINNHGEQSAEQISASDMIQFPKTTDSHPSPQRPIEDPAGLNVQNIPYNSNINQHSNTVFPNTIDSQFLPASDILNPKTNDIPTYTSQISQSQSDSETIPSDSDATQRTQTESNQQSRFYGQTDDILEDDDLIRFPFKDLEILTNNFSDTNRIGCGGFGNVFVGSHYSLGMLAVKKTHEKLPLEMITKTFNTEVKFLSLLRHVNIVPILGFSIDGPVPCTVCEYIDGGSLRHKIANKGDERFSKDQRIKIMIGTAEGLKYIHKTAKPSPNGLLSSTKAYFIHGDVKSSNILLTRDCFPKLCDFGLAKQFDTTYVTVNVLGTQAYMAPESISGTITQKSDVYSYGMVLLELLTRLEPVVQTDCTMNLKDYLKDLCVDGDITPFLDKDVGEWNEAQYIYGIAKLCLNIEKSERPSMNDICSKLHNIQTVYNN